MAAASTSSGYSKVVRVCDACHKRKVSCDLVRPSCSACIKYTKSRPGHVCTYGPGAAFPGEEKVKRASPEDEGNCSLMPAKTRSATKALREIEAGGDEAEQVEVDAGEAEPSSEDEPIYKKRKHPALAPLCLPTTFPTFPATLPPLPSPVTHRAPTPPPSPITPYFTSVFATVPAPELCSPPVLSPRPASGMRRPSFPDHATLFDPAFLAAQRSFAGLSVSPPSTSGPYAPHPTAKPLEDELDGVFAFAP
ncbi:hypothetical protein JCM10213_006521 [Rhodosporidiobolus nylandii]